MSLIIIAKQNGQSCLCQREIDLRFNQLPYLVALTFKHLYI